MATKKRILICDDEEGIRESLKLVLDEAGCETQLATTGIECCQILEKDSNFDLAVLDIKMPQESGLDTLSKIKTKYPDIKVLVATGYKSVDVAKEAIQRGASDYVVKPFESSVILDKIQALLNE